MPEGGWFAEALLDSNEPLSRFRVCFKTWDQAIAWALKPFFIE